MVDEVDARDEAVEGAVVVNDDLERAVTEVADLIASSRRAATAG